MSAALWWENRTWPWSSPGNTQDRRSGTQEERANSNILCELFTKLYTFNGFNWATYDFVNVNNSGINTDRIEPFDAQKTYTFQVGWETN